MKILVADLSLICKLYRIGLLKYFNESDLSFHITGFCYEAAINESRHSNDKQISIKLIKDRMLQISEQDGIEMENVALLHNSLYPKFTLKTASALYYAKEANLCLVTEDLLIRDTAKKLKLKSQDNDWAVSMIVYEISEMGIPITKEAVMEFF